MAKRRILCGVLVAALGCRGSDTSQKGAGAEDPHAAAAAWKLDQVSDPYVRWLAGRGPRSPWPPEPIPGLLAAIGAGGIAVEPPYPNLLWDRNGLSITWDAKVPLAGRSCDEVERAADAFLEGHTDLGPPPAGARRDRRLFYRASGGVEQVLSHSCVDGESSLPKCTGGDCSRPTTLSLEVAVGLRATGATSLRAALEPFPAVDQPLRATLLPPFLIEIVESARFHSFYCERWTGSTCEWDLRFEVVPPGDAKAWILEAIERGQRFGFACDQAFRDPEKSEIAATQSCSGKNLWYHLKAGQVRLRLAAILGAEVEGTPVECSVDHAIEHDAALPPSQDAGVRGILGVPVRQPALVHMDRVREPDIAIQPADFAHVVHGAVTEHLQAELLLVFRFGEMGVELHTVFSCQNRGLLH